MSRPDPIDQPQRDLITGRIDSNIMVEAAAGSGKTGSLVGRILTMIAGGIKVQNIVAITFTVKAGEELKNRIRKELKASISRGAPSVSPNVGMCEKPVIPCKTSPHEIRISWGPRARNPRGKFTGQGSVSKVRTAEPSRLNSLLTQSDTLPEATVQLFERALADLDSASIGTIHSFCLQIISQFSLAMGVSPAVGIMNAQQLALYNKSLYAAVASYLKTDQALAPVYGLLLNNPQTGISNAEIIELVDLIGGKLPALGTVDFGLGIQPGDSPSEALHDFCRRLAALDFDAVDKPELREGIEASIAEFIADAETVSDDLQAVDRLIGFSTERIGTGAKGALGKATARGNQWHVHIAEVFMCEDFGAYVQELKDDFTQPLFAQLLAGIRSFLVDRSRERIGKGTLTMTDVVDQTLAFLRHIEPAEHRQLHEQYRHFLIDEFQDTDDAQFEIVLRILSKQAAAGTDLEHPEIEPGSLFIVGDPKQAIYHFRGGDLSSYLSVKQDFATRYGGLDPSTTELTVNFRTLPRILSCVDAIFGQDTGLIDRSRKALIQPEYVAFAPSPAKIEIEEAARQTVAPLTVIAEEAFDPELYGKEALLAGALRGIEANDIAHYILSTYRSQKTIPDKEGVIHPVRYKDFAVLCPTSKEIGYLRDSLSALNIPFVIEVKSQVYHTTEIIALLNLLRALAYPGFGIPNLVLALRSELFGISDEELFEYRVWHKDCLRASGDRDRDTGADSFDYRTLPQDAPADSAVFAALRSCRDLASYAEGVPIHQLLNRILQDRKQYQSHPDLIGAYGTVLQDAREFDADKGGSLRDYLVYVDSLAQDKQNKEIVFRDDNFDAVSITNYHQSKGREWPICIVAGAQNSLAKKGEPGYIDSSKFREMRLKNPEAEDLALWDCDSACEFKIGKLTTPHYTAALALEKKTILLAEQARLHYVALTRAQYALVLTMHRKAGKPDERFAYHLARYTAAFEDAEKIGSSMIEDPFELAGKLGVEVQHARAEVPAITLEDFRAALSERSRRSLESSSIVISKHDSAASPGEREVLPPKSFEKDLRAYLQDIRKRPTKPAQFGAVIHRAIELTNFSLDAVVQAEALSKALDEASGALDDEASETVEDGALLKRTLETVLAESETIAAARKSQEVYRELPLGAMIEGKTISAYADLVFKNEDDSWTIADYKSSTSVASLADYYRQLRAYKQIFEKATGYKVGKLALIYCLGTTLELSSAV